MRYLFLILFMPILCQAQLYSKRELTNIALTSSLCFTAGMCDGTAEKLKFNPDAFFHCFPGASQQYWNTSLSWRNKWQNGDPAQGERFWQSSRALVFTTDGYHLMRMGRNVLIMSSIVFHIGQPQIWWKYLVDIGVNYFSYTLGFSFSYDLIFRK